MKRILLVFMFFITFAATNSFASEHVPGGFPNFEEQYSEAKSVVEKYIEDASEELIQEFFITFASLNFPGCYSVLTDRSDKSMEDRRREECMNLLAGIIDIIEPVTGIPNLTRKILELYPDIEGVKISLFRNIEMCGNFYKYISLNQYRNGNRDVANYFERASGMIFQIAGVSRGINRCRTMSTPIYLHCPDFYFPNIMDQ